MTELSRNIRASVKQGGSLPAVVVEVFYDRATIKLAGNGAVMRNLSVIGGPVVAGQLVQVDFTTPVPTVVALGEGALSLDEITDLIKSLIDPGLLTGFSWQILTFQNGQLVGTYAPDATGLQTALADTSEGVILLPPGEFTGTFVVQGSAALVGMHRETCILYGPVTVQGGLSGVTIQNSGTSASDIVALTTNPTSKVISVTDVYAYAANSGTGRAFGMRLEGTRAQWLIDVQAYGQHTTAGYGAHWTDTLLSDAHFIGGYLGGSTGPYLNEGAL